MEHPAFRSLRIADLPPDFKFTSDLDRQSGPLKDPRGPMVLGGAFAQVHAIGFEAHITRNGQAARRAFLLGPRTFAAGPRDNDGSHGKTETPRKVFHRQKVHSCCGAAKRPPHIMVVRDVQWPGLERTVPGRNGAPPVFLSLHCHLLQRPCDAKQNSCLLCAVPALTLSEDRPVKESRPRYWRAAPSQGMGQIAIWSFIKIAPGESEG